MLLLRKPSTFVEMVKTGIVLSGGGVRGDLPIWVLLQVLEELQIQPLCYFRCKRRRHRRRLTYTAGHSPKNTRPPEKELLFWLVGLLLNKRWPLLHESAAQSITSLIPENSFESTNKKLYITAIDFANNETVTFSKGPSLNR